MAEPRSEAPAGRAVGVQPLAAPAADISDGIGSLATIVTVSAAPRSRWRAGLAIASMVLSVVFVLWFYWWTVDANGGFEDTGNLDYYQLLVRGWKKGQLHLDLAPKPELLALADPYDPGQNDPYRLGDASLFRNRYYIYFGPAPAFTLMLPYSLVASRDMRAGEAVFTFVCIAFLAATALWLLVRRRYFSRSGWWTAPVGILALGFGTHLLALAQRPMFWELAIAGGAGFGALALLAGYIALHVRCAWVPLALAGLCAGLAVGSRPTCLFALPLLLVPLWVACRKGATVRARLGLCAAAAGPVAACGIALMTYNYARFENPLEWGQNYQLSGAYESQLTHFSVRFLPHNFATYLFQPLKWTAAFPFAQAEGAPPCTAPGYFGSEEVAGLITTFPCFWFLLGLPLVWRTRRDPERKQLAAAFALLAAYAVPVMLVVTAYFSTTMRYEADFAVPLALLALVGLLAIEDRISRPSRWPRRLLCVAGTVAAVATVGIGMLVSLDYHGRWVQTTSPVKWHALERRANLAVAKLGLALGQIDGPRILKVRFRPRPAGSIETFWGAQDPRAGERIVLEHAGANLIRFGYAREGRETQWGRLLRWEDNHTHTVELQLPSLYRPPVGWWANARRVFAFQERTSVAVWFSGGRALAAVVPPLSRDVTPGGRVDASFSGEIRGITNRLYRADEIPTGLSEPLARRGGVLRMRVVFGDRLHPKGEPIFAAGAHYRSSIVFAEPGAGGAVRIVFENFALPRAESAEFRPSVDGHWLELGMASFDPDAYGIEATGDVVVRLDGREILRSRQVAYPFPWGDERIGYNPFGTTCGPYFTGWIRDARWIQSASVSQYPKL